MAYLSSQVDRKTWILVDGDLYNSITKQFKIKGVTRVIMEYDLNRQYFITVEHKILKESLPGRYVSNNVYSSGRKLCSGYLSKKLTDFFDKIPVKKKNASVLSTKHGEELLLFASFLAQEVMNDKFEIYDVCSL